AIKLLRLTPSKEGQQLELIMLDKIERLTLPLAGAFQAMNALCAAGLALATGISVSDVVKALAKLEVVPGRLEHVGTKANGARIFVDYAHTPDALTTSLNALRPHAEGNLSIVFGAGGDRDTGKRRLMGQAAANSADRVYVTDDNPRSEDAALIRQAVLSGCPGAIEIGDRGDAIEAAIASLGHGDVLLIAGKGHETGQIIGNDVLPFDDREIARQLLKKLGCDS
ncbi:MAG: cyanophycin synthetase, partial [Rhodospirillaceae bacterium]